MASATLADGLEHARRQRRDALGVVGLRLGNAGGDHIGVADGLDLLHFQFGGEPVERGKDAAEKIDGAVGRQTLAQRRETDHVAEQDGRGGDAVGDGGLAVAHARHDALRQNVEKERLGAVLFPLEIGDELLFAVAQPLALQRGADARAQQDRIERLGQIVFGAGLDAAHHAVDLVERRNDDDGDVAACAPPP